MNKKLPAQINAATESGIDKFLDIRPPTVAHVSQRTGLASQHRLESTVPRPNQPNAKSAHPGHEPNGVRTSEATYMAILSARKI